jgi:hypothetical protein
MAALSWLSSREDGEAARRWVGRLVWVEIGLGLGFIVFLFFFKITPPLLCVMWRPVFIGKILLGFQTWSLNFFLFL